MDFRELTNIVESLQPGDDVNVLEYNDIKIRKHENPELMEVESPFSSKKQYDAFIHSCFGKVKGFVVKMDESYNVRTVCIHPELLDRETFGLFIQKLGNPNPIL